MRPKQHLREAHEKAMLFKTAGTLWFSYFASTPQLERAQQAGNKMIETVFRNAFVPEIQK
jgi:hypothetical protein